jgi:hypothetical protein
MGRVVNPCATAPLLRLSVWRSTVRAPRTRFRSGAGTCASRGREGPGECGCRGEPASHRRSASRHATRGQARHRDLRDGVEVKYASLRSAEWTPSAPTVVDSPDRGVRVGTERREVRRRVGPRLLRGARIRITTETPSWSRIQRQARWAGVTPGWGDRRHLAGRLDTELVRTPEKVSPTSKALPWRSKFRWSSPADYALAAGPRPARALPPPGAESALLQPAGWPSPAVRGRRRSLCRARETARRRRSSTPRRSSPGRAAPGRRPRAGEVDPVGEHPAHRAAARRRAAVIGSRLRSDQGPGRNPRPRWVSTRTSWGNCPGAASLPRVYGPPARHAGC